VVKSRSCLGWDGYTHCNWTAQRERF